MKTDLDLNLPFSEAPPHLPPVLDNNAYLEFIEFNHRAAAANNTLEGMIAARPRPNPEWFTLEHPEKPRPAAPSTTAHSADPDVHP